MLDAILERYGEIAAEGSEPATVGRGVARVNRNEPRNLQAPPGVRISRRAFGRDRRYPITSGFEDINGSPPAGPASK